MINQVFDPPKANLILQIPLGQFEARNLMSWTNERNAIYTVKSGYKMLWESLLEAKLNSDQNQELVYTTLAHFKQVWKMAWDLKVQPKIRIFMWCLARNNLPPRSRLLSKNIQVQMGVTCVEGTLKRFGICLTPVNTR